jgi:hypothetical protein
MTSIKPPVGGMPIRVPLTVEQRQAVERKIVIAVIKDLLDAGYDIVVNDGDEEVTEKTKDQTEILDAMFSTDEDYLLAYLPGMDVVAGWVRFIYGNDGPDVINDYALSLDHVLATSLNLAELEEEKLHG